MFSFTPKNYKNYNVALPTRELSPEELTKLQEGKREYIITAYEWEDETLYQELETQDIAPPNTSIFRKVECADFRPLSRNTHYWLTDGEVEQLINDQRVRDIKLHPRYLGIKIKMNTVSSYTVGGTLSGLGSGKQVKLKLTKIPAITYSNTELGINFDYNNLTTNTLLGPIEGDDITSTSGYGFTLTTGKYLTHLGTANAYWVGLGTPGGLARYGDDDTVVAVWNSAGTCVAVKRFKLFTWSNDGTLNNYLNTDNPGESITYLQFSTPIYLPPGHYRIGQFQNMETYLMSSPAASYATGVSWDEVALFGYLDANNIDPNQPEQAYGVKCPTISYQHPNSFTNATVRFIKSSVSIPFEEITLSTNGSFTFSTTLQPGDLYQIIASQLPTNQRVDITNSSGIMGNSNVTDVGVVCTNVGSYYNISGNVYNLKNSNVTLTLGGTVSSTKTIVPNADPSIPVPFSFNGLLTTGDYYTLSISQGTNPPQIAYIDNGSGIVGSANITDVSIYFDTYSLDTTIGSSSYYSKIKRTKSDNLTMPPFAKNWAFLRCTQGHTTNDWGYDLETYSGNNNEGYLANSLAYEPPGSLTIPEAVYRSGSINFTGGTGKNVDVVIYDGGLQELNHPEFKQHPDGTGNSRLMQYNWYQHNPEVTGGAEGSYTYGLTTIGDHPTHVAGTVAGNRQGWAKDANIYGISFNDDPSNLFDTLSEVNGFDYIRAWHNSKSINPATGRKNPTIVNNSWAMAVDGYFWYLSYLNYRGTEHTFDLVYDNECAFKVCSSSAAIETLCDFSQGTGTPIIKDNWMNPNLAFNISTTGTDAKLTNNILTYPAGWHKENAQVWFNGIADTAAYPDIPSLIDTVLVENQVTVQGPCTVKIDLNFCATTTLLTLSDLEGTNLYIPNVSCISTTAQFSCDPTTINIDDIVCLTTPSNGLYAILGTNSSNVYYRVSSIDEGSGSSVTKFSLVDAKSQVLYTQLDDESIVPMETTVGSLVGNLYFLPQIHYRYTVKKNSTDTIISTQPPSRYLGLNQEFLLPDDVGSLFNRYITVYSTQNQYPNLLENVGQNYFPPIVLTDSDTYTITVTPISKHSTDKFIISKLDECRPSCVITAIPNDTSASHATVTSIDYRPTSTASLISTNTVELEGADAVVSGDISVSPQASYWKITLPFSITYLGQTYSRINVTTNNLITFGSSEDNISPCFTVPFAHINTGSPCVVPDYHIPYQPKIMVNMHASVVDRIEHGYISNTVGNRIYSIRVYGRSSRYKNVLTIYSDVNLYCTEYVFHENPANSIDVFIHKLAYQVLSIRYDNPQNDPPDPIDLVPYKVLGNGYVLNGLPYSIALPIRHPALDSDIEDCLADGIIIVGAAGNDGRYHAKCGDEDWNNYLDFVGHKIYYNRANSPTANETLAEGGDYEMPSITVGALGTAIDTTTDKETKAYFSNTGPGIDIWAPGEGIVSAIKRSSDWFTDFKNTPDLRDPNYFYGVQDGTSMASPQVTGVLACALEIYPHMTPVQAKEFLLNYASTNQMVDSTWPDHSVISLRGSANKVLYYRSEKPTSGGVYPKVNYFIRPTSGQAWPRVRKKRYK